MSHWRPAQIPDLHGLTAVVTGANSGIGRSAARELARFGATVVLACRSTAKANVARDGILNSAADAKVEVAQLDLADLASVRKFAAAQLARNRPIDILINNAGRLVSTRKTTADGFELTFGGNHLGHFALTGLLLPALLAAPAARVVTVSSIAHKSARLDEGDLQSEHHHYNGRRAYGQSKLANLMFGLELERRFRDHHAAAISLIAHPGLSTTSFIDNGPGSGNLVIAAAGNAIFTVLGQDANRGAFPLLYAATAPDALGGHYYGPSGFAEFHGHPVEVRPAPHALDVDAARRLWAESERLTGVRYTAAPTPGHGTGWG